MGKGHRVCVIGIGNMGSALADALIAGGHRVTVWNRTATKCDPLAEAGASVAATAAEAVHAADTIIICVLNHDATVAAMQTDDVACALNGKTLVQFSKATTEESLALTQWSEDKGARYLDGAILAFPADVRRAGAHIIYSGSKEVFEATKDIFAAFGNEQVLVGQQPGTAYVASQLAYAQYYGITFAYLHTAAMAAAAGISIGTFRDLVGGDDRWQWKGRVMDGFLNTIESGDYSTTEATLGLSAAVYDLYVRMCRELGVEPAFHELIEATLSEAVARGLGDQEISAIFKVLSPNPSETH